MSVYAQPPSQVVTTVHQYVPLVQDENPEKCLTLHQCEQLSSVLKRYQRYQNELIRQGFAPRTSECTLPLLLVTHHLEEASTTTPSLFAEQSQPNEIFAHYFLEERTDALSFDNLTLMHILPEDLTLEQAIQKVCGQHLSLQLEQRQVKKR